MLSKGLFHRVTKSRNCAVKGFNSFPNDKFLDSSKLKEFADDNFKFDESGRKLSEQVENTEGKEEIARYKQFLLFPQCFQKICTSDTYKPGLVWERVKSTDLMLVTNFPFFPHIFSLSINKDHLLSNNQVVVLEFFFQFVV